jgi:hypothetical protein
MDQQQTMELGRRFTEALHAVDAGEQGAVERMLELYSPEARLTNAALKLVGEERRGHDGVRQFWEEYQHTFREARTEFFDVTASERSAGLFWTTRGVDATGQQFEYDGVSLLVFDEAGLIERFRGYYDTRELSRKVGGGE